MSVQIPVVSTPLTVECDESQENVILPSLDAWRKQEPAALSARVWPNFFQGLPEPKRAIGNRQLGSHR